MARFTVFFKDKPIQTHLFGVGVIYIGRENTNSIMIDSLAVAPIHAIVIISNDNCLIKQINNDFPLVVNHQACLEYYLNDNDRISVGKHDILYTLSGSKNDFSENQDTYTEVDNREANLQVMDGKHIGRIIPIKKAITKLGRSGEGIIIISKRKDGYFISALETHSKLAINKEPLNEQTIKLAQHDLISIDSISMQFFLA